MMIEEQPRVRYKYDHNHLPLAATKRIIFNNFTENKVTATALKQIHHDRTNSRTNYYIRDNKDNIRTSSLLLGCFWNQLVFKT